MKLNDPSLRRRVRPLLLVPALAVLPSLARAQSAEEDPSAQRAPAESLPENGEAETSTTQEPAASSPPDAPSQAAAPPAPDAAPAPAATTPAPDASAGTPSRANTEVSAQANEVSAQANAQEIALLKAQLAELSMKQEEAEMAALLAEEDVELEQELFRIYGFMDMGLQRTWVKKSALVASLFDTNALTFVTGNINIYFDFNPEPDWRALAEIRFTGAPLGHVESYGGITGTDFSRTTTEQYDPHATSLNAPMWGAYTVIERAWIEWKRYQYLQVRVGNFFTPFGIWNVDHGSPTLISVALPQFIQQKFIPIRQTGLQGLGSFFVGQWELAYRAWLTNGRTEENLLDFDDDKAFGLRLFARRDGGKVRLQLGASYHHGSVENKVVDVVAVPPFAPAVEFDSYSTVSYVEDIFGADVSLDIHETRIRAEFVSTLERYDEGKRPLGDISSSVPGSYQPNGWRQVAYLIAAQQLPWWGLEPYFYGELMRQDWGLPGDGFGMLSGGLNVRFSPAAMLKLQASRAFFFKWKQPDDFPGDPSINDATVLISRLVLAY